MEECASLHDREGRCTATYSTADIMAQQTQQSVDCLAVKQERPAVTVPYRCAQLFRTCLLTGLEALQHVARCGTCPPFAQQGLSVMLSATTETPDSA